MPTWVWMAQVALTTAAGSAHRTPAQVAAPRTATAATGRITWKGFQAWRNHGTPRIATKPSTVAVANHAARAPAARRAAATSSTTHSRFDATVATARPPGRSPAST